MSWWNPYTWNASAQQAESDRLDAELNALDNGTFRRIRENYGDAAADAWQVARNRNQAASVASGAASVNVRSQIDDAFREGLADGYDNVTGAIRAGINAPARFLWDAIPGWVWLAAIAVALWQLGWLQKWLRPR
jgi:hypothetical protein